MVLSFVFMGFHDEYDDDADADDDDDATACIVQ